MMSGNHTDAVMHMIRETTATPGITRLLRTPDVSAADAIAYDGRSPGGTAPFSTFGASPSLTLHQGYPPPEQLPAAEVEHLRERVKHLERISTLQAKVIQDEQTALRYPREFPVAAAAGGGRPQGLGSQATPLDRLEAAQTTPVGDGLGGGYQQATLTLTPTATAAVSTCRNCV